MIQSVAVYTTGQASSHQPQHANPVAERECGVSTIGLYFVIRGGGTINLDNMRHTDAASGS